MSNREWLGPWITGWTTCQACGHRHVTVQPTCVQVGECPRCHMMSCTLEEGPDGRIGTIDGVPTYRITNRRDD